MSLYSVSWNSYRNNICNGLSYLQQKEEFVDMTLAADGHFVKVHQIIISMASPYLKELIKSAPCPHPVLFLNKISYPILSYILEYIYTGEILVKKDDLTELIEAGKALHIKGLEDLNAQEGCLKQESPNMQVKVAQKNSSLVDNLHKFRSQSRKGHRNERHIVTVESTSSRDQLIADENMSDPFTDIGGDTFHDDDSMGGENIMEKPDNIKKQPCKEDSLNLALSRSINSSTVKESSAANSKTVQYTLSNQGSLQMVLNRFVYFLRYAHKNRSPPVRSWRCVDYIRNRCPASVTTKDDIVIQRVSAHKHAFHDKKIVKKMQAGLIFAAIKDAESQSKQFNKKNPDIDKSLSDNE